MEKKRILLGMSGGVDSTYAASKLISLGYYVEGAILKMSGSTDIEGAKKASENVGIKLNIIDCEKEFKECVIDNFVSEYLKARTPNPCIVCNRTVKFFALCRFAKENGFDTVATGHYSRVLYNEENGRYYIGLAADMKKDQSYVLWRLSQEELSMLWFPMSDEIKEDIKQISEELSLVPKNMKESQEICFIPGNDHTEYIEEYLGKKIPEGDFTDVDGNILGKHKGIVRYTVGQRKGLGISLGKHAFVLSVNACDNTVTLGDEDGLFKTEFDISDIVFQKREYKAGETAELSVKIRYAAKPVKCTVRFGEGNAHITTDVPVRAITPGQSAVFYESDGVVFGGFIV